MTRYVWAPLPVLLICSLATAGEYKGSGYTLIYPAGWTAVGGEDRQAVEGEVKDRFKTSAQFDAMFVAPDPTTNINIIVKPGSFRIDKDNMSKAQEEIRKSFEGLGISSRQVDCQTVEVNGRNFILNKADNTHSQFPERLRQWSLIGSAGGKVYTFTFSTTSRQAAQWEPTFDQVVKSVVIEAGPMDWFLELPLYLRGSIIGAVVGGVIGLIIKLKKKPQPPFVAQAPLAAPPFVPQPAPTEPPMPPVNPPAAP